MNLGLVLKNIIISWTLRYDLQRYANLYCHKSVVCCSLKLTLLLRRTKHSIWHSHLLAQWNQISVYSAWPALLSVIHLRPLWIKLCWHALADSHSGPHESFSTCYLEKRHSFLSETDAIKLLYHKHRLPTSYVSDGTCTFIQAHSLNTSLSYTSVLEQGKSCM